MSAAFAQARAIDISEQAADHFNNPETAGKLFVPNARDGLAIANTLSYEGAPLEDAFPNIDPGLTPLGSLVLVQIRVALSKVGSLHIDTETRRTEQYNTQVAKVIALGPIAFHNRNTGEPWPEGAWCKPGEFVRVPKYQGDRMWLKYQGPDGMDDVEFVLFKDLALLAKYTCDPMSIRAFL